MFIVVNPGLVLPLPKLFTKAIWRPLPTVRNKGLSRCVFATPRIAAAATEVRQVHTRLAAASPQCHGAAAEARKALVGIQMHHVRHSLPDQFSEDPVMPQEVASKGDSHGRGKASDLF